MKITILATKNGWLVYTGAVRGTEDVCNTWSFNSLDKAIACLRKLMRPIKESHEIPEKDVT